MKIRHMRNGLTELRLETYSDNLKIIDHENGRILKVNALNGYTYHINVYKTKETDHAEQDA